MRLRRKLSAPIRWMLIITIAAIAIWQIWVTFWAFIAHAC
jgi:hypothetical protein